MHLKLIKSRLFNNMPPKAAIASWGKNIAGFNAAQLDLPTQHLTSDLNGGNTELAAQLLEAKATINTLQALKLALSNQVSLLEAELSKALEALKVEQSRSAELYQCFSVEHHACQHGAACKDFLESKIEILQATNAQHLAEQKQLICDTMYFMWWKSGTAWKEVLQSTWSTFPHYG